MTKFRVSATPLVNPDKVKVKATLRKTIEAAQQLRLGGSATQDNTTTTTGLGTTSAFSTIAPTATKKVLKKPSVDVVQKLQEKLKKEQG